MYEIDGRILDHIKSWTTGMSVTELFNALNCNTDFEQITKTKLKARLIKMEERKIIRHATNSRRWFERTGAHGRL